MKTGVILIFCLFSQIGFSQTIYKSSIDNGGANVSNANIQMIYTIGEVNVQEVTVGDISISEGYIGPDILSSEIYIPDPNFEQALIDLGFDTDNTINQQISREDAEAVTSLDIHSKEIADLTGIQGFINLEYLYCGYNPIGRLDVSGNTKLTTLICHYNELTELDVSNNNQLEQLVCGKNQITNLEVSHLEFLKLFHCDDNLLITLDVSENPALTDLRCHNNQLVDLDVSMNAQLSFLDCSDNAINSLDLLSNTELEQLRCKSNEIPELILTNNPKLLKIECGENNLHELDLSSNPFITELMCMFNEIEILEVSHLDGLTRLFCTWNKITDLDLRDNKLLYQIECNYNELITLDLRSGTNDIINSFDASNNEYLSCISVDDELANHSGWIVNTGVIFSNDCGYNTQRGVNVKVALLDKITSEKTAEVTFDDVELSGETTIEVTKEVVSISSINFIGEKTVYNIETTAEYEGDIDIVIDYAKEDLVNEDGIRLFHKKGETWEDVTTSVDQENDEVHGTTSSLSPFVIIEDIEPPVLSGVPDDLILECSSDVPENPEVTVTDNVDQDVTIEYNEEIVEGDCANNVTITKTWSASDDFGNTVSASQVITVVDDLPPVITVPADVTIECGGSTDLSVAGMVTAIDNCGEILSISHEDEFVAGCGSTGVISRTWRATDECGNVAEAIQTITIVDTVLPILSNLGVPLDPVPVGTSVSVSCVHDDEQLAEATIDWGDGFQSFGEITASQVTGGYIYSIPGVYVLSLYAWDACGNEASVSHEYIVVYDPDGGFVTGGGWIYSPPGAYISDPALEGKANFGFVSKYKKGTTVPIGNTEFQFKAGDLNFKSDLYDWLVVAGEKAKFKGEGTINEVGSYGFMISAIDGDEKGTPDLFRMKIWEKSSDVTVYDNQFESDDTADPTTILGGGSIVVHDGKDDKTKRIASNIPGEGPTNQNVEIKLYPNPVRDVLTVDFGRSFSEEKSINIHLYNLTGVDMIENHERSVSNNRLEIDINDLPSGIYILVIPDAEHHFKYKLTKL